MIGARELDLKAFRCSALEQDERSEMSAGKHERAHPLKTTTPNNISK